MIWCSCELTRTAAICPGPEDLTRTSMSAATANPDAVSPPSRTELMLLNHEFRTVYRSASLRADGSLTRGRKTKHDTATRRWIDTVGFPLLAMGKLPEAQDLAMLRSGPRSGLQGAALAARDACTSGVVCGGICLSSAAVPLLRCWPTAEAAPAADAGLLCPSERPRLMPSCAC